MIRKKAISIAIIDARCAVREGLKGMLQDEPRLSVVGALDSWEVGLEFLSRQRCEIAIVGAPLFVANTRSGRRETWWTRMMTHRPLVALYVEPPEEKHIFHDLAVGADGHIRSAWDRNQLIGGLTTLARNRMLIPRECALQYAKFVKTEGLVRDTFLPLSEEELDLGRCVGEGQTDKEVAITLGIGVRKVRRLKHRLFDLMGVTTRTGLASKMMTARLISSDGLHNGGRGGPKGKT